MSDFAFRPQMRRRRGSLNLTSLIDVLFLLLIFFMLTSTFRMPGELELELPDSTTSQARDRGAEVSPLTLSLDADGSLRLDGEEVAPDQLASRLQAARESGRERVVLEAEAQARHADVVKLIDQVREAGFSGLGLGTQLVPRHRTPQEAP